MYKNITNAFVIGLLIILGGCEPYTQQQEINQLREELNTLKVNNSGVVVSAEQAEQQRLEAELQALKARQSSNTTNTIVNNVAPIKIAPVVKYGPGSGNHLNGSVEGYLTIRTNSANGKLTLRTNPDQGAQGFVEIPNGTSDLYYFNRVQVGDYVWYNATYGSYTGWLRGDYVDSY
jgi:hypothetical protein